MSTRRPTLGTLIDDARHLTSIDQLRLAQHLLTGLEQTVIRADGKPLNAKKPGLVQHDLSQLTYEIIGHAMEVHRELGPGYREDTYQRDLESHFDNAQLPCAPQKLLPVYDTDISHPTHRLIGYYIPDFIVAGQVVVEIKALPYLDNTHTAQVIGYLAVTGCKVGLLLNFGQRSLEKKRILPPKKIQEHRVNRQWLFVPDWLKAEQQSQRDNQESVQSAP